MHSSLSKRNLLLIVTAVMVILVAFFLLTNLATYPTISGWDEGMYLQFAHNLAYYGQYATRNGDVFERLIPPGGTGLTLIAPVGLALRMSNDSLLAARLVIALYFGVALLGVYLLLQNMDNRLAGLIGIPLVMIAGYQNYDTLWAGRQVLAEVPALAFLCFGLWTWQKGWSEHKVRWSVLTAILLGLTVITKNQLIWVLMGTFGLLFVIDLFFYRQLTWDQRLAPIFGVLIGYGSWLLVSTQMIEPDKRAAYLEMQYALADASFFHPPSTELYKICGSLLIVVSGCCLS